MFISSSRGRRLPAVVSALLVTPLVAVSTVLALATPGSAAGPASARAEGAAARSHDAVGAVPATGKRAARAARGIPAHVARLNWRGLARCESSNNPRAVNPAGYYGLYQFDVPTWRSVGGRGFPHHAAATEQTYRAQRLYMSRGRSPWPHCGRYL
jgi:soluble lytic murein transglycosylase-like protein